MRLTIENLHFSYTADKPVLSGIDLSYETPDILCILGKNGVGKSTLLRAIMGEVKPTAGEIRLDGQPLHKMPARTRACHIGYIPQNHVPSFGFPVRDVVAMGRTAKMGRFAAPSSADRRAAAEQMAFLGIEHLADVPYTDISGGERRLVLIAAALAQAPEVLLLDEPTTHLDFGNQFRFLDLLQTLRARGTGVIMSTHFPDHALRSDGPCAIMEAGKLTACGDARTVITEERMTALYDLPLVIHEVDGQSTCLPTNR
ncbi:MAG: ABC transporter ATP-binding protein, partial [Eubacteriales bacterium]|nr:ABC transporter ATP-binding protein [Eubacteriales bacterium]